MGNKTGKIMPFLKKCASAFCSTMACKKNLKRDIVIFTFAVLILTSFLAVNCFDLFLKSEKINKSNVVILEEQIYQEVKSVQETVDMSGWKTYQSQWYGFEVKYPEDWPAPERKTAVSGSDWEYRFQFRKKDLAEENFYSGFDIVIYNLSKVKELSDTEEFPVVKSDDLEIQEKCENIKGHIIETGDYPAEEIYIPPNDDCYRTALFFDFIKGEYIYVLAPMTGEVVNILADPRVEIVDHFPEFFSIASTLNPIDIVRPKPVPVKPKITAPYPVSYKKVNGRLVCAKKNDHPSKSKQNKKKHMDMECCLDPDEYPNPHCYYPPEKYGEYL